MKKMMLGLVALAFVGLNYAFAGDPVKTSGDHPQKVTKTYTFKELKEKYGENLLIDAAKFQDQDLIEVQEAAAAPPNCTGIPCRAAIAQASKQYQAEANACCCSFAAGIICCENGLWVEYLVLFEPQNCN